MIKTTKTFAFLVLLFLSVTGKAESTQRDDDPLSYRQSLQILENQVPLTYNEYVRSYINSYTNNQKKRFSAMLGLSKYYFPIYEKIFSQRGVPDELKYLSIVESSLDPTAVSKAEAAGPWQFLHAMGKIYGLTVNDSIDERLDPTLACNAAASYLLDSYKMFGNDWLIAIASYNCGRNNIRWAIEDSGGKKDYWSIRKYLPVETQNYVPAFIATVYIMNNARKHGIRPTEPWFATETEIMPVKRQVSIEKVAQLAKMSPEILSILNPSYKRSSINGSEEAPKSIIIPILPTYSYNAICDITGAPKKIVQPPGATTTPAAAPPVVTYVLLYTVQQGDTYSSIANKFTGTSEQAIKEVNKLTDAEPLLPGTMLKIRQKQETK